jgi:hypothetical protein
MKHNKAVSRRWIEAFNERDDAGEADVRGPDYVAYAPASLEPDPLDSEAWTRFLAGFVEPFPDLQLTVEDAVGGSRPPTGRSSSRAWSSIDSSTAESRSTGSRWTHSRFFSSWA